MTPLKGWQRTTLGDLGRYLNGRAFKRAEWRDEGRPIIRIQNLTGSSDTFNYFQGEADVRHVVRHGDLLVSWAATLGAYLWDGPEAVLNQHIFKVESRIDKRFHKYLLDHKLDELKRHTHGSGMVHITRRAFDSVPVDVPDLGEQRQIVELLEEHLSRLDAADAGLASSIHRLDALKRSVLAELHDGDPVPLAELAWDSGYGTSEKCVVDGPGVPVVRIPNLVNGVVDLTDEKRVADVSADVSSSMLAAGDLLIVRTNGSVDLIGRSAVVQDGIDAAFASYLIRYRVRDERVRPAWVQAMLSTPQVRRRIEPLAASSAGQHNLSLAKLDPLKLPVPSLEHQDAGLARLREVDGNAASLRSEIERARSHCTGLRRSLLVAAFSGQLTAEMATA